MNFLGEHWLLFASGAVALLLFLDALRFRRSRTAAKRDWGLHDGRPIAGPRDVLVAALAFLFMIAFLAVCAVDSLVTHFVLPPPKEPRQFLAALAVVCGMPCIYAFWRVWAAVRFNDKELHDEG